MTDELTTLDALIRLTADPTAFGHKLVSLQEQTASAREARLDAEIAEASLAKQTTVIAEAQAALNAREAAIATREAELHFKIKDGTETLRKTYLGLVEIDNAIKRRILQYADLLQGFSSPLQSLPDWPAIEKMLGGPRDVYPEMMAPATELTQEAWGGDQLRGTLTRSMPAMDMAAHDAEPTPANRPADASARSRRKAARRAAHP